MTYQHLKWQSLLPNIMPYDELFLRAADLAPISFEELQPRLNNALTLFCHPKSKQRFMLVKAKEHDEYLCMISRAIEAQYSEPLKFSGKDYVIEGNKIHLLSTRHKQDAFAPPAVCLFQNWVEPEQLFGSFKCHQNQIALEPGLIHRVNGGGVLVISMHTLLAQPLMWLHLKQMIIQERFEWISPDEKHPLPVSVPSMPLDVKLVLVGNSWHLEDFVQHVELETNLFSLYGEFETELSVRNTQGIPLWCRYINTLTELPLAPDAWPIFIREAFRKTGDHGYLPLCPIWIKQSLSEASLYDKAGKITADALNDAFADRHWRQNYLSERIQNDIEENQVLIDTTGDVIGQINGLAVIEYPGHPQALGEPTRISCVVHFGDGELVDVERKVELGGNLHAKGMMIMQAFLISELALEQPQPFSASLVFEQSYAEIDGDSASLAELCALISALAQQPIHQARAVTGSIDQLGRVQPIGGINEKIEGFFQVCKRRGLTGSQGVILPSKNVRHLCLNQAVIDAVKQGIFHLWAVDTVQQALPLLMDIPYSDPEKPNLLHKIRERITQVNHHDRRGFLFRFLEWFQKH